MFELIRTLFNLTLVKGRICSLGFAEVGYSVRRELRNADSNGSAGKRLFNSTLGGRLSLLMEPKKK